QYWTNKWDTNISIHLDCPYNFPARLGVAPIMRRWKGFLDLEMLREALAKITERLYVAVRPVYSLVTMAEVNIRRDKYTAVVQDVRYFGELLGLEGPCILKKPLGDDDV